MNTVRFSIFNGRIFFKRLIIRCYSQEKYYPQSQDDSTPVRYSTSKASQWKASYTVFGKQDRLWYEPFVIFGSFAVMLLYFCVFREESDIDAELTKSLYNRIEGLEELQIQQTLEYNKSNASDISRQLELNKESKSVL